MFRSLIILILFSMLLFDKGYTNDDLIGPGDSLSLGYYSAIHNNINNTIHVLRKKELQKYSTFKGFGSYCRSPIPAIDRERMDESILIEVSYGITSGLVRMLAKNNATIDSDSLNNLSLCLSETYRRLTDEAQKDENSLSQISTIGLYSDGDTANSDYDIIADIEKINSILFTERLDYRGTTNSARSSYDSLARGDTIPHIFEGMSGVTLDNRIIVTSGSIVSSSIASGSIDADISMESLGISTICTSDDRGNQTGTNVKNMIDDTFLSDLQTVMSSHYPGLQNTDTYTYGNNRIGTPRTISGNISNAPDFFHSRSCSSNFCIKVKTVTGGGSALTGGKTYSIESLLDKHSKIMEPIANSNLSAQKHQKNSFQLPFLNIKLRNKLSGGTISMENSPQQQKKHKEEYTQAMQDQEFDHLQRCAYINAGLPGNIDKANIYYGVGYQFRTTSNSDTVQLSKKILGTLDPSEEAMSRNCMSIALGKPSEEYYTGLNTDLTELEVFTSALMEQIDRAITTHKKLDTLRSK